MYDEERGIRRLMRLRKGMGNQEPNREGERFGEENEGIRE